MDLDHLRAGRQRAAVRGYGVDRSAGRPRPAVVVQQPGLPRGAVSAIQSTEKGGLPTGIPTQVTRRVNIGEAAQQANPVWQAALAKAVRDSPYQFYQLIDIQWPQTPAQLGGNPTPGLLANTTMETYISESSCLNCHFTARTASDKLSSDYSFTLAEAARAPVTKGVR